MDGIETESKTLNISVDGKVCMPGRDKGRGGHGGLTGCHQLFLISPICHARLLVDLSGAMQVGSCTQLDAMV